MHNIIDSDGLVRERVLYYPFQDVASLVAELQTHLDHCSKTPGATLYLEEEWTGYEDVDYYLVVARPPTAAEDLAQKAIDRQREEIRRKEEAMLAEEDKRRAKRAELQRQLDELNN